VFDTNHDGKLDASDAEFAKFKVEVTNADGSTSVKTLTELGITSINLVGNATHVSYVDGRAAPCPWWTQARMPIGMMQSTMLC
jgi:trimeric autotransporter adhesin